MEKGSMAMTGLTLVLTLSACGGGGGGGGETSGAPSSESSEATSSAETVTQGAEGAATAASQPSSETASATPDASASLEPTCSGIPADQAVADNLDKVPEYETDFGDRWAWAAETASATTYDDCAELSAITVTVEAATASSPYQILLFSNGEYMGTANSQAYGFAPEIARVDDSTLQVTYRWAGPEDANANPTESAVATYTVDPETDVVTMSGDLPPNELSQ